MSTGPQPADAGVPREAPSARRPRDMRRLGPTAALAEMIGRVLNAR